MHWADHPLLFDRELKAKPAFEAVVKALKGSEKQEGEFERISMSARHTSMLIPAEGHLSKWEPIGGGSKPGHPRAIDISPPAPQNPQHMTSRPAPILPGATIGVLGSGQLGRMFTLAARKMGYRVHTLSPEYDTPTGQVADREIVAPYEDLDAVAKFAREVSVVTFEFENVSAAAADAAARFAPVRPAGRVLHTTQHRLREKIFLSQNGFPITPYAPIGSLDELRAALAKLGAPAILKSAGFGYDGKGQFKIMSADQAEEAWEAVTKHGAKDEGDAEKLEVRSEKQEGPLSVVSGPLSSQTTTDHGQRTTDKGTRTTDNEQLPIDNGRLPASQSAIPSSFILHPSSFPLAVLESFVDFTREVSVVAARGVDGSFAHWGVIENHHFNHILDVSVAPAPIDPALHKEAVEIARGILEALDVVGVLCVEFFLTRSGKLLVNELAPRPHNSGHLTFDASVTSQFEQQLRAICGLPLGDTRLHSPAAMAQLLGDMWLASPSGTPNWQAALENRNIKLHLYGKADPRKGRKMGHLTALAATAAEARNQVLAARNALVREG